LALNYSTADSYSVGQGDMPNVDVTDRKVGGKLDFFAKIIYGCYL